MAWVFSFWPGQFHIGLGSFRGLGTIGTPGQSLLNARLFKDVAPHDLRLLSRQDGRRGQLFDAVQPVLPIPHLPSVAHHQRASQVRITGHQ